MTTTFRQFIQCQLALANIDSKYRDSFTDPESMEVFTAAFTHPTADPKNNYQVLEYVGDGIIKAINSQYIPERFASQLAQGQGEGVLSKLRRHLEQSKTLADFALKLGFWDYVRADEDTKSTKREKTLEDVFEAFIGAMVKVIDHKLKMRVGYTFAYDYVSRSLNEHKIELSEELLDDPITRLNELYKAKELKGNKQPLKWGDAAYQDLQLIVPNMEQKPSTAQRGDVIFLTSVSPSQIQVYDGSNWLNAAHLPLMKLQAFSGDDPVAIQKLWLVEVYGFPITEAGPTMVPAGLKPSELLKQPAKYQAQIIGQGLHFTKNKAKKQAASQAIRYLNKLGYSK
jgi:dsRNA-specific ribonuclease